VAVQVIVADAARVDPCAGLQVIAESPLIGSVTVTFVSGRFPVFVTPKV